ncbi:MFS transporter [Streptomyces sp. NPDC026672]|uniref:MFS transporter n=1 Tax=unclassified Streptomyces TaxID=2593676 RepID=UPI00340B18FA
MTNDKRTAQTNPTTSDTGTDQIGEIPDAGNSHDPGDLLAALDHSEFTRRHGVIYGTALAGHFLNGFAINTTGVVLPGVIAAFHLTGNQAAHLTSALFLGMLVGAAVVGIVSDRLGRKFPLALCLLVFAGFSILAALSWSYESLMTARFCQGIGLGAEIAVVLPYITEFVPSRHRAPLVTAATAAWLVGLPAVALVGAAVVPAVGWRTMFYIGIAPVLVSAVMVMVLPESVRYLVRKGRHAEARAVVASLSTHHGTPGRTVPAAPPSPPPLAPASGVPRQGGGSVWALLSGRYLRFTLSLWFMEVCAGAFLYGLSTYLPSVLKEKGIGLLGSLTYTAIITASGVAGALLAGQTAKRVGRRFTIGVSFVLSGAFCLWWGAADSTAPVVVLGCVATFFGSGFAGSTLFVYASELYPTVNRATGLGWAAAWQKVGGLVIPSVITWVLALRSGSYVFFVLFAVISLLAGVSGLLATLETRGRTIEQIAQLMQTRSPEAPRGRTATASPPVAP